MQELYCTSFSSVSHYFIFLDAIGFTEPKSKSRKWVAHAACFICTLGNQGKFNRNIQIADFS